MTPLHGNYNGKQQVKRDHKEEFKQLIAPPKYGHIDETEIHNGNSQLMAFDDLIENDFNDI